MMDFYTVFIPLIVSFSTVVKVLHSQRVETISEVVGYEGDDVTLSCYYIHGNTEDKLSQVEWTWRNQSKKESHVKIIIYSKEYGSNIHDSFLKNKISFSNNSPLTSEASIVIKDVKMTDQGIYSCEYTTYPSGSYKGETTLKVKEGKPPALSTAEAAGIVTAVLLIIVILVSVGYLLLKRRRAGSNSSNCTAQRPDDPSQEITYADVRILKPVKVNTTTSQTGNTEYAAVTFSGRSGSTSLQASANQLPFTGHIVEEDFLYTPVKKIK